jgi:hypothetical protein
VRPFLVCAEVTCRVWGSLRVRLVAIAGEADDLDDDVGGAVCLSGHRYVLLAQADADLAG